MYLFFYFQFKNLVSSLKLKLSSKSLATEDAAKAFIALVTFLRENEVGLSKGKELKEVLKDRKNKDIV